MIITIDGPTASGKSTTARKLAKKLGYFYVYSGLLYRALAYLLINEHAYTNKDLCNPKIDDVANLIDPNIFYYQYDDQFEERVFFKEVDITPHLKTSHIDNAASILSTNKDVRKWVTGLQRQIARDFSVVVDGRDAGTVVFPDADIKFYLTAQPNVRAQRWLAEQKKLGIEYSLEQALEKITLRDKRDSEREVAPLQIPDNAIVVDNSNMSIDEIIEHMLDLINKNV